MYFKRVQHWTDNVWEYYYEQYPLIKTEEDKRYVRYILTSNSKEYIELSFGVLRSFGIINGIGPSIFGNVFLLIITWLFSGVKHEYHDIEFGLFGTLKDYFRSNYGLLKYSFKSVGEQYYLYKSFVNNKPNSTNPNNNHNSNINLNPISTLLLLLFFSIPALIQSIIIIFCYIMITIFGFISFRFIKSKYYYQTHPNLVQSKIRGTYLE